MSFDENLRQIRKERGLTQERLAECLNVSRQAVSKWESDSGYPETETLMALAECLNVSVSKLLGDAEEQSAPQPTDKPQTKPKESGISIQGYDSNVHLCSKVWISPVLMPSKNEPTHILNGVDRRTLLFGEHSVALGFYACAEDAKKADAIFDAISRGESAYQIQYAAKIRWTALGQPRLTAETDEK